MPRSYNQKMKCLYLMRLLTERTDEHHAVSMRDILEHLQMFGITAERKSIYDDIETLRTFGLDILNSRGTPAGYYLASRDFELPELKLLVDAVQSSKFITTRKSMELIKKLESLASRYEAQELQRQVMVTNRIKTMNESIYYNVDILQSAMLSNAKIRFQYFEWDVEKKMALKRDGGHYVASPWRLLWDDENYYLMAVEEESGEIRHFRVDKMLHITRLEEKREGKELFDKLDPGTFARKTFGMFGGREETVELLCVNRLINVMIDRFGKEAPIRQVDETHFSIRITVTVSQQFFGWLTGLGREVVLQKPVDLVEEYEQVLQQTLDLYHK